MSAPDSSETPGSTWLERGIREHTREAAGRTLRTVEAGVEGQPVVLCIHGLPGSAEDWERLAGLLGGRFHVIAIDRPGYGGSGEDALRVSEQVGVYAALLEELGGGPALVLGHSYGSLSAAELAARRPELVAALGLLAPAMREERRDRQVPPGTEHIQNLLRRPAVASFVKATVLSRAGRTLVAKVADPISFHPDPVDHGHMKGVAVRTLRWSALRSFLAEASSMAADSSIVEGLLGTLTMPVAVIHAAGDRVVEPIAGRRTAATIPGCELHEIEGGHMLTISRADEIVPILEKLAQRAGL